MGRSSRIFGLITGLACVAALPPAGEAAGAVTHMGGAAPVGMPVRAAGPSVAASRAVPGASARTQPSAGRPAMRGPEARHGRRFDRLGFRRHPHLRRGLPFGVYDYGDNLDAGSGTNDPYGPSPGADEADSAPATDEPPDFPEPPRPCVRPLIIKIGRGLRHPAKTRVVYGGPPACVRGY